MRENAVIDRLSDMLSRTPSSHFDYFALTLLGDSDGTVWHSLYSHWVGYADEKRHVEIRSASIVHAKRVVWTWREIGESCAVVHDVDDMAIYLGAGGHAVVEKSVAELLIDDWLQPSAVRASGPIGFVSAKSIPKTSLNRAPGKKLRMTILRRDQYRCRICGRRATDYVDVELHVHHIRPWQAGGLTEKENLITLCHTCHMGLDPHFEPSLFDLMRRDGVRFVQDHVDSYWAGVRYYREQIGNLEL